MEGKKEAGLRDKSTINSHVWNHRTVFSSNQYSTIGLTNTVVCIILSGTVHIEDLFLVIRKIAHDVTHTYICMHTHTHTHTHTHACMHTHTCMHTYSYIFIHSHIYYV